MENIMNYPEIAYCYSETTINIKSHINVYYDFDSGVVTVTNPLLPFNSLLNIDIYLNRDDFRDDLYNMDITIIPIYEDNEIKFSRNYTNYNLNHIKKIIDNINYGKDIVLFNKRCEFYEEKCIILYHDIMTRIINQSIEMISREDYSKNKLLKYLIN